MENKRKSRYKKRGDNLTVRFSKTLTLILRHKAKQFNLPIREDGFLEISKMMNHSTMNKFPNSMKTVENIKQIVENCKKNRFSYKVIDGKHFLKCNQGHSFPLKDLELKKIKTVKDIPFPPNNNDNESDNQKVVLHGTYYKSLPLIFQSGGLCTMERQHIHFAIGLPEEKVKSGIRFNVEVLIYLDIDKCLKDGVELLISSNQVILCPGTVKDSEGRGILPYKYFKKIVDRKTLKDVNMNSYISKNQ